MPNTANHPQSIQPLLLTRDDAAKALGVGVRTLDAHNKEGNINCINLGRLVRYSPLEIERVAREGLPRLSCGR